MHHELRTDSNLHKVTQTKTAPSLRSTIVQTRNEAVSGGLWNSQCVGGLV